MKMQSNNFEQNLNPEITQNIAQEIVPNIFQNQPSQVHTFKPKPTKIPKPTLAKIEALADFLKPKNILNFNTSPQTKPKSGAHNCMDSQTIKVPIFNPDDTKGLKLVCAICQRTVNYYRIYNEIFDGISVSNQSVNYTRQDNRISSHTPFN